MRFFSTTYVWAKSLLVVILLLATGVLALFPVLVQPYTFIDNANMQAERCERMVKDVLLLQYLPASQTTTRISAQSELQDSLPLFKAEEAVLAAVTRSDAALAVAQISHDYTPLSIAFTTILTNASALVDPLQVAIVLQYEHAYTVGVAQLIVVFLQDLNTIDQEIFVITACILVLLLLLAGADPLIMRAVHKKREKCP